MGCWNETCGFSQQSITAGEDVIAFLILNNETPHHSVYGNGMANPMAFPIHAQYNDYGSIEKAKVGFSTKTTIALFNQYYNDKKLLISDAFKKDIKQNINATWDGYVKGFTEEDGFSDVETIFYGIERGYFQLRLTDWQNRTVDYGLGFMLIKKDVLLSAWETLEFNDDWERKDTSMKNIKADIQKMIDELMKGGDISTQIAELEKELEELQSDLTDNSNEAYAEWKEKNPEKSKQVSMIYSKIFRLEDSNSSSNVWGGDKLEAADTNRHWNFCRYLSSYDSVHRESFRKLYTITKDIYSVEIESDMIENIAQFIITLSTFNLFRKMWVVQGHASQDDNFDSVIDYTERLLARMYKERQRRFDNGYYEDGIPQIVGSLSIFEEGVINDTVS